MTNALPRTEVVTRFRETLAVLGAPPTHLIAASSAWRISCETCLEAAAKDLALPLERPTSTSFEAYEEHHWAPVPGGIELGSVTRQGLVRVGPADGVWLAFFEFRRDGGDQDLVLAAAKDRPALLGLVAAVHRRHVAHERAREGLIAVGSSLRMKPVPLGWEDVLLPADQREDLARTVREFFASAELYRRHGVAHRRGILLAGPPGNGKTTILRTIAATSKVPLLVASLDSCMRREALVRSSFSRAAELAPSVLCFEDLDALVGEGPLLAEFLNLLDGLEPLEGVLVVATTNRPDRIDPAIAKRPSRFDRVFVIGEPDRALRATYLAKHVPRPLAERYAGRTEGYSVAFLKELVIQARFAAIRRSSDHIEAADLDLALETIDEHLRLAAAGLEDRGRVGFA